jgi:hypothetical protein
MTEAWASIVVAIIGIVGSILTLVLNKIRKENRNDHDYVKNSLNVLHEEVKEVGKKIDNHIDWHLKK